MGLPTSLAGPIQRAALIGLMLLLLSALTAHTTPRAHERSESSAYDPPTEPAARTNTRWYNDTHESDGDQTDWMGRLPDELLISELSIPGTHESHAFEGLSCWIGFPDPWCSICQRVGLPSQLRAGVRALDVRLKHHGDNLKVFHGHQYLYAHFAGVCTYEHCYCGGILDACVNFLQEHPGEAIFMRVAQTCTPCHGLDPLCFWCDHCYANMLSFGEAIEDYLSRIDKNYVYVWPSGDCGAIPTLGDVRGKIVILQDFLTDYHVGDGGSNPGWTAAGRVSCTGDFDGDSDPDLAVANKISHQVHVFLHSGDGVLTREPLVSVPESQPWSICSGDLDGNGYDDLVITLATESQVGVILRHPVGSLPMVRYDVGEAPREACVADFDQDGDQDLVVMNFHEGVGLASLLWNHGDGTFAPQEFFMPHNHPYSVTVANLNGDAYPDLATTHMADDAGWDRFVKAFINTRDGTFDPTPYWVENVYDWGPEHIIAADFDGPTVYAAGIIGRGDNDVGQCDTPEPNTGFVAVAAGRSHSLGLKADGSIVAWGSNDSGQCNVPAPDSAYVAVAAGVGTAGGYGDHSLALKANGTIAAWGDNMYGQCDAPPDSDFVAIAAGALHSLALKEDSTIVAWGDNSQGQLDVPTPNAGFVAVAGGVFHSLVLKADSTIVAWGDNSEGQLDVPAPNAGFVALAGGAYHSLGLKADGTIVAWGRNIEGQCDVPDPNSGFAAVAGGSWHSLGLKEDGEAVAWGSNADGQCYVPARPSLSSSAIAAGRGHSLVIVSGGFDLDDLAVTFPDNDLTQVFRNTGDGMTLAATISSSTPEGVAAADMDNDQDQDLVVVAAGSKTVSLYRNDGDDSFPEFRSIPWGKGPVAVAAADFDEDSDIDLAVTEFGPLADDGDGTLIPLWGIDRVSIQRNQDDGETWCPASAFGPYWSKLLIQDEFEVTDLNAKVNAVLWHLNAAWNGERDEFYVNFLSGLHWAQGATSCATKPQDVAQFVNPATGEFLESYLKDGVANRCGMIMADFPGDGLVEVVASHNRFFDDIPAGLTGVSASDVAWGDYDGDGDLDILLTGDAGSGYVSLVYRNDGGNFTDINAGLAGVMEGSVAWGDYDNDADLDILLSGVTSSANVARVYRNDDGVFTDIGAGLSGVWYGSVAWGDCDNDGDLDILLTGYAGFSYVTKVYRNDAGSFTDIGAGLTDVAHSSVAWGDYDNDGDLDILLTGDADSAFVSIVYRNDAGSFTDIDAGLTGVREGSGAWGDCDNDGDLDILLTGLSASGSISRVYRNEAGSFTDIGAELTGACGSSAAWGDRDNDGNLDFLLTGTTDSGGFSRVYCGDGSGGFTVDPFWPQQMHDGSAAWGDYDNDGDLDLVLSGEKGSGYLTLVYQNNLPTPNTPPTAPTNLIAQMTDSTLVLGWDAAKDTETPAAGLTYNLRVGTTPGGGEICAAMADAGTGLRRVAALGNVNHNLSWAITLPDPPSPVYYWSVQAIDASFAGSAFAEEQILGGRSGAPPLEALPTIYALHAAAPNPFRAGTTIRFDLPQAGQTRLEIFNVAGRRVRVLENGKMNPGRYAPVWDGRDEAGRAVSPGVYFVRLEAGHFHATQKVVHTR
jgi:hypothetical protein